MADSPSLPSQRQWRLVESPSGGPPGLPVEFFKFFRELLSYVAQTQGNTASLTSILARLDALEAANASVTGQYSVRTLQQDAQTLVRLVGDLAIPGSSKFYGTNADGTRGWYERALSTLADVDLTGLADGDALVWDATAEKFVAGATMLNPMTDPGDIVVGGTAGAPERLGVGAEGEVLTSVAGVPTWAVPAGSGIARGITVTGGNIGGEVIAVAQAIGGISPSDYTLTGNWYLWCAPTGSIELDVRVAPFGSLPPGPGDSICGGNFPEVVSGLSGSGDFTGWSTSIAQTDTIYVVVTSITDVTWFVLMMEAA